MIGHSLGAYVSQELAQRIGGVDRLVLFDPANQAFTDYKDDVIASDVSKIAKAFYTSLGGDYARDADESYLVKVDGTDARDSDFLHGFAKNLFSWMMDNPNNAISQKLSISSYKLATDLIPNTINQDGGGDGGNGNEKVFEAVLKADKSGKPTLLSFETQSTRYSISG